MLHIPKPKVFPTCPSRQFPAQGFPSPIHITLLVKVSQGHKYQTGTNKLPRAPGAMGVFSCISRTRAGKHEQTNFLRAMGLFSCIWRTRASKPVQTTGLFKT
ncbi:uncharacterized protein LACBIDRAFT_296757 [Laccaria bicolor S238N-H82]|uniref:Predicted protein n=1 Tax=Laccaria bicolor (strain S238N-H82 / ATCC MYA-4686) TaxID=486041 RepID=B0E317_LACBS|nr:uncharacterized protein LACBIDRAFT_296757 [Laccaria bicolor S238N-H82]EDQ98766.1 predicted protein [Laccaria bicolor S238N-H82]|eukprot:XP_001890587.1 predicted protein [Laccaria bicolor S238N-H82]